MSTKEQSVTLLRKNKLAQVDAFQAIGMTDVTEETRASTFADRIIQAAGIRDICVACKRLSDGTDWYFTKEEWSNLTNANKGLFVKRGLRVRAYGHTFVVAAQDCYSPEGSVSMKWGSKVAVSELANRIRGAAYNDFAGLQNTGSILDQLSSDAVAASACKNYTAYAPEEAGGVADASDWHLPSLGILIIMYRIKPQMQDALSFFWNEDCKLGVAEYWSSTQYDRDNAWFFNIGSGIFQNAGKTTSYRVRAVCDVI